VIRFEDNRVVPVPVKDKYMNYTDLPKERGGLKPLHIVQPDGPSFSVDDHNRVRWQGWTFRVGFTSKEGAVLHTLTYQDPLSDDAVRSVAQRVSVAEMVVPYGDPDPPHYLKNAFDAGEDGLGRNAHSLQADGCDCLGEITYLDAALVGMSDGKGETVKNAICIHEEDSGMLWKHIDWRTGHTEVRRGRRLVVSFICTVANYEYGFYYYLGMDGGLKVEVKLTGIVSTGALMPEEMETGRRYGTTIAPGLYAPAHQHFFVARIDASVDGPLNRVVEVEVQRSPRHPTANRFNNAFHVCELPLQREQEAKRDTNQAAARHWLVQSATKANRMGSPTAFALMPHTSVKPMAWPDADFLKRAGFLRHHLWVTPFSPEEKYPGGDYPNQSPGGEGLEKWTQANRPIDSKDIVLWYTFGITHVPRLEDWPVMPVETVGFSFVPFGFFDRSPALDVPPADRIPGQQHGPACKL